MKSLPNWLAGGLKGMGIYILVFILDFLNSAFHISKIQFSFSSLFFNLLYPVPFWVFIPVSSIFDNPLIFNLLRLLPYVFGLALYFIVGAIIVSRHRKSKV